MDYNVEDMAEQLLEVFDYIEEVTPILEALEESSGVILVDSLPFPANAIGLIAETHAGKFIVSYDMQLFALLELLGVDVSTPVKSSLKRYLQHMRPSSKTAFIETTLFRTLLNAEE